jgi:tRNA (guanosine-2'-O-)-methyltransferase
MSQSLLQEFLPLVESKQITEHRLKRIVETATKRQRGLMVLMEAVKNPHNLAAIARSCDAFGVQHLAYTLATEGLSGTLDDGDISSATAAKWLDYRPFEHGTEDALKTLKAEGYHLMATWVNPEAKSIYEVDFTQHEKLVLMLGSEWHGLSETAVKMADSHLYIPMRGMLESFNVSVAAALSLFEITRQRLASPKDFSLPEDEARELIREFIRRSREKGE